VRGVFTLRSENLKHTKSPRGPAPDGDCFAVGYVIELNFVVTQHSRDREILEILKKQFSPPEGGGSCDNAFIYEASKSSVSHLSVTKFPDIVEKILPFFNKYPLHGAKLEDFEDFCRVAPEAAAAADGGCFAVNLMKVKAHLTDSGLEQIKQIRQS